MATVKQNCGTCGKLCDSKYVVVGAAHHHPECFKCEKCKKSLVGIPYAENGGKFYCEDDANKVLNPTCAHCEDLIYGPYLEAMGKFWHEHHFVCSDCGGGFPNDKYSRLDGRPYCANCASKRTGMICDACKKEVIGETVFEAMDKKFHLRCFVCCVGNHVIGEGVQFGSYEDRVYCEKHLIEALKLACAECNKELTGEYISVGNRKMHANCWKCSECKTQLNETNARKRLEWFVCKTCAVPIEGLAPNASPAERIAARQAIAALPANATPAQRAAAAALAAAKAAAGGGSAGSKASASSGAVNYDEIPVITRHFAYEMLLGVTKDNCPPEIVFHRRELYLPDDVFVKLFGMTKEAFQSLPRWRQIQKKKQHKMW